MKALLRALLSNRWIKRLIIVGVLLGLALAAKAYHDTMRAPLVQRLVVESKHLAPDTPSVTIALVADIHMAGLNMPPERVRDIVSQVNALEPDLITLLGDYVTANRDGTKPFEPNEIVDPLTELSAPLGVVAVPGNHDHWYGWPDLAAEFAKHSHITVLENGAAQFGPIAVAGLDDEFTGHDDMEATRSAMLPLSGAQIWLSHTPDTFPSIPVSADLVLAGHTHCGQIAYPWGAPVRSMSAYGETYACGIAELHGKTLVTSAGLGTSLLPVRLFTQPEIWVIEMRGPRGS